VWTSRGKIDVHDGKPTEFASALRFVLSVVLVDFSQQEW
jgi:hypothetical protein